MKKTRKDRQRELRQMDSFQSGFQLTWKSVEENKKIVFGAVVVVLSIVLIIFNGQKKKEKLEIAAYEKSYMLLKKFKNVPSPKLKATEVKTEKNQTQEKINALKEISENYPDNVAGIQATLELGKEYFQNGELKLAEEQFSRVIEKKTKGDFADLARLSLAQLKGLNGAASQAEDLLKKLMNERKSSFSSEAGLLLSKSLLKSGKNADAKDILAKLNKRELPPTLSSEVRELLEKN